MSREALEHPWGIQLVPPFLHVAAIMNSTFASAARMRRQGKQFEVAALIRAAVLLHPIGRSASILHPSPKALAVAKPKAKSSGSKALRRRERNRRPRYLDTMPRAFPVLSSVFDPIFKA